MPPPAAAAARAVLADLFPAPAAGPAARRRLPGWAFAAIQAAAVAAGAAVMLARIGGRPAWQSVYAEDPGLYLPAALAHPWQLLASYAGYLQLMPRLIAQIAALLPVRHAAAVFAVAGAAVAAGCALFTGHACAGQVRHRWLRVLAGLSVLLLPVAQLEIADTGVNAIWYLLAALFWAALWRPASRSGAVVSGAVAFAAAASSSLGLLFAPVLAARLLAVPRRVREHGATIGWAAGSALQAGVILSSHQSRFQSRPPLNAVRYYLHYVLVPALGWHLSWHLRALAGLTAATAVTGGLLAVVLGAAVITQRGRSRAFVLFAVAGSLLLTAVSALLAWGGPDQMLTVRVEHGARYSTLPILFLVAALIVAADGWAAAWRPGPRAVTAVVLITALLAAGWVTDFRYPVRRYAGPSSHWSLTADRWLAYCDRNPGGRITATFYDSWTRSVIASTFSCSRLRR